MAKGNNAKLKLIYLSKIFEELTDEDHKLTMDQIITELEKRSIDAERKSIYKDIECLKDYGMDIVKEQIGRQTYYYLDSREFDQAQIKLIIDNIVSSKFISQDKSDELVKKLKGLLSIYQASDIQRQVYVTDRVKSGNETIFATIDKIHHAIAENKQISFKYHKWNEKKEWIERHNGDDFVLSPWALVWDNEYYYLNAYDPRAGILKHYRVDRMSKLHILDGDREGKELFDKYDKSQYSKGTFAMYHGEKRNVKIRFPKYLIDVFIDRFGKDAFIIPDGEELLIAVDINVSDLFFGWVLALGPKVKIKGPEDVVEDMKKFLESHLANY